MHLIKLLFESEVHLNPLLHFRGSLHDHFLKKLRLPSLSIDKLDVLQLLESVILEYQLITITGLEKDNPENDMLLLEYGNYDWNRKGMKFNISIKRQLFIEGMDEPGFYGLTVYYNSEYGEQIESYSSWCDHIEKANQWLNDSKELPGFLAVKGEPGLSIESEFELPH